MVAQQRKKTMTQKICSNIGKRCLWLWVMVLFLFSGCSSVQVVGRWGQPDWESGYELCFYHDGTFTEQDGSANIQGGEYTLTDEGILQLTYWDTQEVVQYHYAYDGEVLELQRVKCQELALRLKKISDFGGTPYPFYKKEHTEG